MTVPPRLREQSVPMQVLILTEMLLANPGDPVDLRVVNTAQGGGYVAERLETAARDLASLAPHLLEAIDQL